MILRLLTTSSTQSLSAYARQRYAPHRLRQRVAHVACPCLVTRQSTETRTLPKSVLGVDDLIDQQVHRFGQSIADASVRAGTPDGRRGRARRAEWHSAVAWNTGAKGFADILCWRAA